MTHKMYGPQGIWIKLDTDEIFPADPGMGTPVLVGLGPESGAATASYGCAVENGELSCGATTLTPGQWRWLCEQEVVVDEWLTRHTKELLDESPQQKTV